MRVSFVVVAGLVVVHPFRATVPTVGFLVHSLRYTDSAGCTHSGIVGSPSAWSCSSADSDFVAVPNNPVLSGLQTVSFYSLGCTPVLAGTGRRCCIPDSIDCMLAVRYFGDCNFAVR